MQEKGGEALSKSERGEEPPGGSKSGMSILVRSWEVAVSLLVLSSQIPLLEQLLDGNLGSLSVGGLLEGLGCY